MIKEYKTEIKVLTKDLGKTNKEIIDLKKKTKDLDGKDAEHKEVRKEN